MYSRSCVSFARGRGTVFIFRSLPEGVKTVNIFIDESMLSGCFKGLNKITLFPWKGKTVSCLS